MTSDVGDAAQRSASSASWPAAVPVDDVAFMVVRLSTNTSRLIRLRQTGSTPMLHQILARHSHLWERE